MSNLIELKNNVLNNYNVSKADALKLVEVPLNELINQANEIRQHFCGNSFDA